MTQLRGLERLTDESTMYLLKQGPSICSAVVVSQAAFQNWLCEQDKQWWQSLKLVLRVYTHSVNRTNIQGHRRIRRDYAVI
jgi:hypothetical protein